MTNDDMLIFLNAKLQTDVDRYNTTPVDNFDGLTPHDMYRLLYSPIGSPAAACALNESITNDMLKDASLVNELRLLVRIIQKSGFLTLTKAGYLPSDVCLELAEAGALGRETWWYHHKKSKKKITIVKEADYWHLQLLHRCMTLFGLARKQKGKLFLTKKAEELLAKDAHIHFYNYVLTHYFNGYNWGFQDHYQDATTIQNSALFSVHLVQKYGQTLRSAEFYTAKFNNAYPLAIEDFIKSDDPSQEVTYCYTLRVFEHCFKRFGLITTDGFDLKNIRKTPLMDMLFIWKDVSWR